MMVASLLSLSTPAVSAAGVTVTIDPKNPVTVVVNATRQFSATVTGAASTAVVWSLAAPAGVSPSAIGTITTAGKYTAPSSPLPGFAAVTVTVASAAQPTAGASNTITVTYPTPSL